MSKSLLLYFELVGIVTLLVLQFSEILSLPISTTILLLILGWISLRVRKLGWKDLGLERPGNMKEILVISLSSAVIMQLCSMYLVVPFLQNITQENIDVSIINDLKGNVAMILVAIVISWILAAFGEELVYRGYLLNRFSDVFKNDKIGNIFGCIFSVLLFSMAHEYQGIVGVIDTGITALLWGIIYLKFDRNLWVTILSHGFYDTFGILLLTLI